MANFAKVRPTIWRTHLRPLSPTAKFLGIYLMTNNYLRMIGIYYLPIPHISIDTGLTEEEINEGIDELTKSAFCLYDEDSYFVWVVNMAFTQVAENPNQRQVKGIMNELLALHKEDRCCFVQAFLDHYKEQYAFLPENLEQLVAVDW